jgi:tetratricopeptide (TPR) repeat protein/predicted O-methyltransferase YrrM
LDAFHHRFGAPDTARAIHRFTPPIDTHVVLALLAHASPRRVLEVGTAGGHMTANLTEWTPDEATVFSLGVVSDLAVATTAQQRHEDPSRGEFGRFANFFGKAHKVLFATADSMTYDFGRLGPLDFAFIDGGNDAAHVLSDTLKAYGQLAPGGCLVWHDIDNPVAWVEVRQTLEAITFAEPLYHVAGTMVAFLHKQDGAPAPFVRGSAGAVERGLEALRGRPVRLAGDNGAAAPRRQRVSLCLIVKNEEHNLPACLDSAADLVDEVVIVDTGSADATKEVARRYRARVFDFPWVDSFATARNESLRHATSDWVLWMDADDRLDDVNREKLRALFAGLGDDRDCYVMKCRCLPDPSGTVTVVDHVRLFRNLPELRWKYRVHEQILPAVRRAGGKPRFSDVTIDHVGYQDPALRRRKLGRDLRLLQMEDAENPDDPFTLFNLGMVRQELGTLEEAAGLFRRSLALSRPADSIVRKLYALLAQCERRQARPRQALDACREGRSHYPDDPELLLQESLARGELGDGDGAVVCLERLLAAPTGEYLASVDAGLRGYLTRSNLAALYAGRGRDAEALTQWQAALAERPDYVPAWVGLGEFYLGRGRLEEVDEVAGRLEALPAGRLAGRCLRGRSLLARKEFAAARTLLVATRAEFPEAATPCVYLSHALLQEGRDWVAAEETLRAVLRLDPDDRTARNNLGVLLRQQGRPAEAAAVEGPTLAELYRQVCDTRSDLQEHCPTLAAVARECRHVTEFGTGTGVSTVALLYARPGRLVCYDRERYPQVDRLEARAGRTEFVFHQADVLQLEIEETDLLFIDTNHVYEELKEELLLHTAKVKKFIVLHATTTFGLYGEAPGHAGLWAAVEELLREGAFRLKERYENNHGLTVLERVAGPSAEGSR